MAPVYPVQVELFPEQGIDLGEMTFGGKPRGRSLDDKDKPPLLQITPVAPGSYNATAIILLSDGRRIYMQLDEPTLREVPRMTGGRYHQAGTAEALRSVYENLGSSVQVQTRETEVSALLALMSAVFALAAGVLLLVWFRRVVRAR